MNLTPIPVRPINIKLPLARSSVGAFATNNTTLDAVRNNIDTLLKTNWGERPMQYYFGANLRALLFEPAQEIEQQITDRVNNAIEKWMPAVYVVDITVTENSPSLPSNAVQVDLTFGIINTELTGDVTVVVK